jgi:hypothetical protein
MSDEPTPPGDAAGDPRWVPNERGVEYLVERARLDE